MSRPRCAPRKQTIPQEESCCRNPFTYQLIDPLEDLRESRDDEREAVLADQNEAALVQVHVDFRVAGERPSAAW